MTRSEEQSNEVSLSPEDYAKLHQRSFRVAFDFLAKHFPPGMEPGWWEQSANDLVAARAQIPNDGGLLAELLLGVYNYLNEEYKRRRDSSGEVCG
jgi:hypothetical protein